MSTQDEQDQQPTDQQPKDKTRRTAARLPVTYKGRRRTNEAPTNSKHQLRIGPHPHATNPPVWDQRAGPAQPHAQQDYLTNQETNDKAPSSATPQDPNDRQTELALGQADPGPPLRKDDEDLRAALHRDESFHAPAAQDTLPMQAARQNTKVRQTIQRNRSRLSAVFARTSAVAAQPPSKVEICETTTEETREDTSANRKGQIKIIKRTSGLPPTTQKRRSTSRAPRTNALQLRTHPQQLTPTTPPHCKRNEGPTQANPNPV